MDMFPYPSGAGLHVGHPLGYIATDVVARFRRMSGDNVMHALAFDAFGLPAEQYAVQTGQHPRVSTEANIDIMKGQLRRLGLAHDPRRSFATIDPDYVRWTQWIFLQIFNSWYDPEAPGRAGGKGRARPISELVAELESGTGGADQLLDGRSVVSSSPERRQLFRLLCPRRLSTGARAAHVREREMTGVPSAATGVPAPGASGMRITA